MSKPLNAKGRPFSWSYTALADYEGCPKRYAASRFYCTMQFKETEAIIWGNRVHKAGELALLGVPHNDPAAFEPVKPFVSAMLASPHKEEAEVEVTLTDALTPTKWFAKDAWLRIKLDVVMTLNNAANLYDYKTGKVKDDTDQLRLCAAALSTVRPHLEQFTCKYIWTKFKVTTGMDLITKAEVPAIWQDFLPRVKRMEDAWRTETFPARPSPLCPWCDVSDCLQRRGAKR